MSKITKKQLARQLQRQESRIDGLVGLLASKGFYGEQAEPQLKQLDQSVFDGLDEKWRFATVDGNGSRYAYVDEPRCRVSTECWVNNSEDEDSLYLGTGYDNLNWQNSLIERESELTGSDLCRAMLARGDKFILCGVSDSNDSDAANHEDGDFLAEAITDFDSKDGLFGTTSMRWDYAVPINNQGEPLTAKDAGL